MAQDNTRPYPWGNGSDKSQDKLLIPGPDTPAGRRRSLLELLVGGAVILVCGVPMAQLLTAFALVWVSLGDPASLVLVYLWVAGAGIAIGASSHQLARGVVR